MSRLAWLGAGLATLWLVVFHASLLYSRFADASITQPGVLARWIASLFLIAGGVAAIRFAHTRRQARHAAFVIGVLVLLLHVSIPADERLLLPTGALAVVFQTAISVAPAVLLLSALLIAARAAAVIYTPAEQLVFAPPGSPRRSPSAPRSPPSN